MSDLTPDPTVQENITVEKQSQDQWDDLLEALQSAGIKPDEQTTTSYRSLGETNEPVNESLLFNGLGDQTLVLHRAVNDPHRIGAVEIANLQMPEIGLVVPGVMQYLNAGRPPETYMFKYPIWEFPAEKDISTRAGLDLKAQHYIQTFGTHHMCGGRELQGNRQCIYWVLPRVENESILLPPQVTQRLNIDGIHFILRGKEKGAKYPTVGYQSSIDFPFEFITANEKAKISMGVNLAWYMGDSRANFESPDTRFIDVTQIKLIGYEQQ